ncbi:hypothetical protein GCM10017687_58480 [Streptomyces echinatus]
MARRPTVDTFLRTVRQPVNGQCPQDSRATDRATLSSLATTRRPQRSVPALYLHLQPDTLTCAATDPRPNQGTQASPFR